MTVTLQADALLFDNDGVLVDSHVLVDRAWRALADEVGFDVEPLLSTLNGMRAVDTLGRVLDGPRLDAAVARLEELEVAVAGETPALTGARELVGGLPPDRWAIVTSASRRLALARWRGAGIPVPAVTVTADEVTRGKPDPEPFLAGAARLGVAPDRCVVFEDSASGGVAAAAAGCTVVAVGDVAWPVDPAARVPDLAAVTVELVDGRLVVAAAG